MRELNNKKVFITGAGSGLGRELALAFAQQECEIAVMDINRDRASETLGLIIKQGGKGFVLEGDVSNTEHVDHLYQQIYETWKGLDILINNAGVSAGGFMEKIPVDKWHWLCSINLFSVIYFCRVFIPLLKQQPGGYIVNIASMGAIASLPEMSLYNLAKAGVVSLSETLKMELAPHNVGVSVAIPTFFKSNLMDQFYSPDPRQRKMAQRFFDQSKSTAQEVAYHILKGIKQNRFYIIPQKEGKFVWRFKRWFPEYYLKKGAKEYTKRISKKK